MKSTMFKESLFKQMLHLYLIVLGLVFVVYFAPMIMTRAIFIIILLLFWYSKKDYFWFALFFILLDGPTGISAGGLRTDLHRLPIYSIGPGLSFSFQDLFFIAAFVKAFNKGKTVKTFFAENLNILFAYLVLLYIFSVLLGMSLSAHIQTLRALLPLTLFFALPVLLYDKNSYIKIFYLVSPAIIFIIVDQFFYLTFGFRIVSLLKADFEFGLKQEGFVRLYSSPFLNLFCFSMSAFLIAVKGLQYRKKLYVYLIFSLCFILIFFSATRGWMAAYSIMAILTFIAFARDPLTLIKSILPPVVVMIVIILYVPVFQAQLQGAWERLSTLEYLREGDVTAGGTLQRFDKRSPRVMEKFEESPIFGFGFSNEYQQYTDGHVGNQNILLNGGIVGYLLFLLFWINFNKKIYQIQNKLPGSDPDKKALLVIIITFIGIFIIHSSSMQFFVYEVGYHRGLFLALFFCFAHFVYKESRERLALINYNYY